MKLVSVPSHLWLSRDPAAPLVLFGLLSHEQKMSVINCVLQRHSAGHQRPIRAKERLIFHVGFRRFGVAPVFSQHTNGDKHKVGSGGPPRGWRGQPVTQSLQLDVMRDFKHQFSLVAIVGSETVIFGRCITAFILILHMLTFVDSFRCV